MDSGDGLIRCFVALDLPREAINYIEEVQDLLKKKNLFHGKFIDPENLHLTLKFLGEISEEKVEEVKKKLSKIKFDKVRIRFDNVGMFSKKFMKIVWIRCRGADKLQAEIDKAMESVGFKVEARFMGHITLARIKGAVDKGKLLDYIKKIKIKKIEFDVDQFFLKKSELRPAGPIYSDLGKYSLES